jgi:hypothetical protein
LKFFVKSLLVLASVIAVYFTAISLFSIYYKKEIEERVTSEINKNLVKPISIREISISAFSNFPFVSFSLHGVFVPKADSSNLPLLKLEKLQILFAPHNIVIKKFKVEEILFLNGFIDARVDSLGNRDFDIVFKRDSANTIKKDSNSISQFNLKKIKFENLTVFYENRFKGKRVHLVFKNTETHFSLDSKIFSGQMHGSLYSKEITLRPGTLLKEADLKADLFFTYNMKTKIFAFEKSILLAGKDSFLGQGSIDIKNQSFMTLNIKTKQADIQHVFRLIPERWSQKLKPLNLNGNIDADATIKISLLPGSQPNFNINFATQNFSVNNQKINVKIHNMNFAGNLTSTDSMKIENYKIAFENFSAVINQDDSVKAKNISLENFKDPVLKTEIKLKVKTKTLFDFIQFKDYSNVGGNVALDMNYHGKLNYLFGIKSDAPEMTGLINLNHVNLKLNKIYFAFDDLDGKINFQNDSIQMNKLAIRSGKTDMQVSGSAYHLFNSVFNDTTGLIMNVSFVSNKFYFNDFNTTSKNVQTKTSSSQSKKESPASPQKNIHVVANNKFILPYDLKATFTGKVANMFSRNFHGDNIELDIKLANKNVKIVESMNSFGGSMDFTSIFTPIKNEIHCKTNIRLRKFKLDQVFAAFNNFNQKILTSNNIRGTVSGDVYTYFKMNSSLVMDTNSIYVNGKYNITKLELIHVEPLMKLSKVGFDEKDLDRVTFDKISSSIIMKDHVLEIPRTLYVTNILFFYLDVTIQPDGESNFYILLPIKNMKKKPDTSGLTNDSKAGLSIPIKITGKAGKLKIL